MIESKVTIAIPVFNCEKYIKEAVISAINQTIVIYDIIMVDDGSTDNTMKAVNEIMNEYDSINFKFYQNKANLGYEKTWNKCLKLTTSEFFILLHADDILKPNSIKRLF